MVLYGRGRVPGGDSRLFPEHTGAVGGGPILSCLGLIWFVSGLKWAQPGLFSRKPFLEVRWRYFLGYGCCGDTIYNGPN